ncbi:MAG: hypothetical protein Q4F67_07690 [Propionibacteriaceae bacterium]|nr:hypothetical protein [Propionibacteriaceae bacterium]
MSEPWWTLARWAIVGAWGLLAVLVGDPFVRWVFRVAGDSQQALPRGEPTPELTAEAIGDDATEPVTDLEAAGALLRGGKAIGWLERVGTYATLLAGFPAGMAAIVAVKGLARYPDLKAADGTAERFILGTFTSLLIGAAGAGIAHWCLGLLPVPP